MVSLDTFICLGGSVAPGSQELTRRARDRSPRNSMVSNNELRQIGRTLGIGGKKREIIFEQVCDPQGYPYK